MIIILTGHNGNLVNVVKAVRPITGLGLKEAKDFVCAASEREPRTVVNTNSERVYRMACEMLRHAGASFRAVRRDTGAKLITEERKYQRKKWSKEHDAQHIHEELTRQAAYLIYPATAMSGTCDVFLLGAKYATRLKRLQVAGALIAAEMDRLINGGAEI